VAIPEFKPALTMENAGTWELTASKTSSDARKLDGLDKILTAPVSVEYPAADADVKVNKDTGAIETYAIKTVGGTVFSGNFTLQHATGALKITPTDLQIKASDRTKITGAELPTLGVEFIDGTEFKHGDTASDVFDPYPPSLKWNETPYLVGGDNVVLTANNGVNLPDTSYDGAILFKDLPVTGTKSNNYNIITSSGKLTVTKQPIQFAWNPGSTILTYGDMLSSIAHLNATSASTITIGGETHTIPVTATYVALNSDGNAVGGNLIGGTLDGDKKLVGGTLALAANNFNAGTVNVKVTVAVDTDKVDADAKLAGNVPAFGQATQTIAFSVGKKGLNVKADDQTKTYNTEAFDKTDITYTTADFVAGEDATFIKKAPTVADPTNKTSNVGDY